MIRKIRETAQEAAAILKTVDYGQMLTDIFAWGFVALVIWGCMWMALLAAAQQ